jgi:hypothetical protein
MQNIVTIMTFYYASTLSTHAHSMGSMTPMTPSKIPLIPSEDVYGIVCVHVTYTNCHCKYWFVEITQVQNEIGIKG